MIPVAEDMKVNPGICVKAILANPEKTHGNYAIVQTEIMSFEDMLKVWSEVTGRQSVYMECSLDDYIKLWGVGGAEFGVQLKFGDADWSGAASGKFVTSEDLGIKDAIGLKGVLEALKTHF
jgi:hypothetical protein